MLLSVRKENVQKVLDIFIQEEVEATCIGYFTEEKSIRLDYLGTTVAELDTPFLFQPPILKRVANWNFQDILEPTFNEPHDLTRILLRLLSSPNIASKEDVIRTYDHEVRGNTVLKPLQGRFGGPNDAAVIKPLNDSWRGVVISCGINPRYGKIDPYWMAASVIDEAIRNNVAVGGRRISLLDNFSWGNPEKEDRLGGLLRAVKACYDFSMVLETPFVSGKDSLYNESPLGPVNPTLLITGIGIIPDIRKIVSVDLKKQGNPIVLVGKTSLELGGSEYYKLMGYLGNSVPKVDALSLKQSVESITEAIDLGYVKSCHDLSEGGLAVAAAEMSFSGGYGIEIDLRRVQKFGIERDDYVLFSESNSRFLLEVNDRHVDRFKEVMKDCTYSIIGKVRDNDDFLIYGLNGNVIMDCDISDLRKMWKVQLGESYE
jgi:phosphoribosylformylglycinamidine synthase